ncbi:YggT family protein [Fervidibacillus halotolerans]|uniref:YggT family protein n=1 Tax=Fervidibacillus halotolerans TaxID=2980027 RepID=A0A9E8RZS5_9BACI|nr:YggT family protein [Fervidibacillus halotolerans]WAA13668.1 YggT family protein [Fervidibacillus halotolerans]
MDFIISILSSLLNLYFFATIIYIFMSWVPNARESQIGYILSRICEPYLEPFRRFIPPIGMIDFSPIVALFVLQLASQGLHVIGTWF